MYHLTLDNEVNTLHENMFIQNPSFCQHQYPIICLCMQQRWFISFRSPWWSKYTTREHVHTKQPLLSKPIFKYSPHSRWWGKCASLEHVMKYHIFSINSFYYVCAYLYRCVHVYTYIYVFTNTYIYIYMLIYIYIYTYLYIQVHMYTYVYSYVNVHVRIYMYRYLHMYMYI